MNLTKDQILSEVTALLEKNGFSSAKDSFIEGVDRQNQRVFEDPYCIVAAVFYEDWQNLSNSWHDSQASFVELISKKLSSNDRKSWDSYIAFFTTSLVPLGESQRVHDIRYDTRRVRKLLATGEQLKELNDIEDALLPLLPIQKRDENISADSILSRLPELVANEKLEKALVEVVVSAFQAQKPIALGIHEFLVKNET